MSQKQKLGDKKCPGCSETKDLSDFYDCGGYCKTCRTIKHRDWMKTESGKIWSARWKSENFLRVSLREAKGRSRKFGVPFDIQLEYLESLWKAQAGKCLLSGLEFEPAPSPLSASLDRIVPNLGYVRGNVRFVVLILNIGMNKWGFESYLKVAQAVVDKNVESEKVETENSSVTVAA